MQLEMSKDGVQDQEEYDLNIVLHGKYKLWKGCHPQALF